MSYYLIFDSFHGPENIGPFDTPQAAAERYDMTLKHEPDVTNVKIAKVIPLPVTHFTPKGK